VDTTDEFRFYTTYEDKTVPINLLWAERYRAVLSKGDVKTHDAVQTGILAFQSSSIQRCNSTRVWLEH
jgi:hypothetical protein